MNQNKEVSTMEWGIIPISRVAGLDKIGGPLLPIETGMAVADNLEEHLSGVGRVKFSDAGLFQKMEGTELTGLDHLIIVFKNWWVFVVDDGSNYHSIAAYIDGEVNIKGGTARYYRYPSQEALIAFMKAADIEVAQMRDTWLSQYLAFKTNSTSNSN